MRHRRHPRRHLAVLVRHMRPRCRMQSKRAKQAPQGAQPQRGRAPRSACQRPTAFIPRRRSASSSARHSSSSRIRRGTASWSGSGGARPLTSSGRRRRSLSIMSTRITMGVWVRMSSSPCAASISIRWSPRPSTRSTRTAKATSTLKPSPSSRQVHALRAVPAQTRMIPPRSSSAIHTRSRTSCARSVTTLQAAKNARGWSTFISSLSAARPRSNS
mmetsp:Transcript_22201/g.57038  ORF Transcript_22201/g.57038 Transcript_22201/m.57038 type:complete len:216 (-) Transcript_22201:898-1545(-)